MWIDMLNLDDKFLFVTEQLKYKTGVILFPKCNEVLLVVVQKV